MTFEQARVVLRELYGARWFAHQCGRAYDVGYLLGDVGDVYDPTDWCITGTGTSLLEAVEAAQRNRQSGNDGFDRFARGAS